MTRTIRIANSSDVRPIAAAMRVRDINEVRAASGWSPEEALRAAFDASTLCWTFCDPTGEPFAMGGAAPFPGLDPHYAAPWMLATDGFARNARHILRHSRACIAQMHSLYPVLVNYVDCRNTDSLHYLRMVGFTFSAFEPEWGHERRPFLQFMSTRHV